MWQEAVGFRLESVFQGVDNPESVTSGGCVSDQINTAVLR